MSHPHQLTDIADVMTFLNAGRARFTLVSKATGNRFTYRVRAAKDGRIFFVSLMTGPDNERSFTYLGTLTPDGRSYRHGVRSPIAEDAPRARAFAWFHAAAIVRGDLSRVEFWHEGKCGRCGRTLTVPESIERGIGPECAGILGVRLPPAAAQAQRHEEMLRGEQEDMFEIQRRDVVFRDGGPGAGPGAG